MQGLGVSGVSGLRASWVWGFRGWELWGLGFCGVGSGRAQGFYLVGIYGLSG